VKASPKFWRKTYKNMENNKNLRQNLELIFIGLIILAVTILSIKEIDLISLIPYLPLEEWSETLINWLNLELMPFFNAISFIIKSLLLPIQKFFVELPSLMTMVLLSVLAYYLSGRKVGLFVLTALIIISSMGFFKEAMTTLSLVVTATLLALIVGIPTGILKARSKIVTAIADPILDFMQTMPLFVYLIPAVLFFHIGNIPGIVATFIFATPPAVRLTSLGIEQIPKELIEAGKAFGTSTGQFLKKVEIPLAMPSIMAGVNQTIMLALSMVVVASMVGAKGLGLEVYTGITRLNVGKGIASGIGIVLLAMILDRITRTAWKK